jgi:hypothetical protein
MPRPESGLGEHHLGSALPRLEPDRHQGLDRVILLPLVREGHLLVRDDLPVLAVRDVTISPTSHKDFGQAPTRQGGVLDRIDWLCFAGPICFHLTRYFFTP